MCTAVRPGPLGRLLPQRIPALVRRVGWGLLVLASMVGVSGGPASAQAYIVQHLGTLGGSSSRAYAINNHGHVVGTSQIAGDAAEHAFLHNGFGMRDLGTLGGMHSHAHGINDRGMVTVDLERRGNLAYHAFRYDLNGMHDLGAPADSSYGYAIDYAGNVVGHGPLLPGGSTHALRMDGFDIRDLGL